MTASIANRGLHRFAVFTSACAVLLLTAGALVTSNDAGLAVPDWPLSYGSLFPPMVGGILYEHGHRLMAMFVGLLTIILALWMSRREPRAWVRRLGWAALGLVIAQGVLGGITVLFYLPPAVSSAHATLAQLFFVTLVSLALFTSAWWRTEQPSIEDAGSPKLRVLAVWTSVAITLQLVLGAAFRHNAFGIVPHLMGAAVVTILVVWTGRAVRKRFRHVRALRRGELWLHSLFGVQVLLGGGAYWAVRAAREAPQPMPLFVAVTVAHVVFGALTLGASALLTLCCYRLIRPAKALAASPRPQGVMV